MFTIKYVKKSKQYEMLLNEIEACRKTLNLLRSQYDSITKQYFNNPHNKRLERHRQRLVEWESTTLIQLNKMEQKANMSLTSAMWVYSGDAA